MRFLTFCSHEPPWTTCFLVICPITSPANLNGNIYRGRVVQQTSCKPQTMNSLQGAGMNISLIIIISQKSCLQEKWPGTLWAGAPGTWQNWAARELPAAAQIAVLEILSCSYIGGDPTSCLCIRFNHQDMPDQPDPTLLPMCLPYLLSPQFYQFLVPTRPPFMLQITKSLWLYSKGRKLEQEERKNFLLLFLFEQRGVIYG